MIGPGSDKNWFDPFFSRHNHTVPARLLILTSHFHHTDGSSIKDEISWLFDSSHLLSRAIHLDSATRFEFEIAASPTRPLSRFVSRICNKPHLSPLTARCKYKYKYNVIHELNLLLSQFVLRISYSQCFAASKEGHFYVSALELPQRERDGAFQSLICFSLWFCNCLWQVCDSRQER